MGLELGGTVLVGRALGFRVEPGGLRIELLGLGWGHGVRFRDRALGGVMGLARCWRLLILLGTIWSC